MKKQFFALFLFIPLAAIAQLKAPKSVKADTLIIVNCVYDGTNVAMDDWPAKYFTETPEKISIAGQNYIKNKHTDSRIHEYQSTWDGYINYYSWGNATVNGKKAELYRVETTDGCSGYPAIKYGIDDYSIYAVSLSFLRPLWPQILEAVKGILEQEDNSEEADKKVKALFGGSFEDNLMWYQYFAMQIFANSSSKE